MPDKDPKDAGTATLLDQAGQPGDSQGQSGDGDGQKSAWVTDLPEDLKGNATLGKFDSVAALAKGYIGLESLQGNSVRIPDENATAEERGKFFEKLGQPATKEGYEVAIAESLGQTSEDVDNFRKEVHALNLTKAQAEKLWRWSVDTATNKMNMALAKIQKDKADALATLQRPDQWGADTDANLALVNTVAMRFGGEELLTLMRETRIGDDPIMLKAWLAVGKQMSEDTLVGGNIQSASTEIPGEHRFTYDKSPKLQPK